MADILAVCGLSVKPGVSTEADGTTHSDAYALIGRLVCRRLDPRAAPGYTCPCTCLRGT